ncbi:transposase [Methylocystis rosea]|uniref:transposase n=1 Tax=Methylocystis rosea TaxID=173366 RepID=UPI003D7C1EAF
MESNSRLVAAGDDNVAFSYKGYRRRGRCRIMRRLSPDAFIRRFPLHVLPDSFHRIRPYGLLPRGDREERLALCHRLTVAAEHPVEPKVGACGVVERRTLSPPSHARLRRTHAPHRHRSDREASPAPMRHVMSPAITSAWNPAQLPVSLVVRYGDGTPPRAVTAKIFIQKIFIHMTPMPRQGPQTAAHSSTSCPCADFASPTTSAGARRGPANNDETRFPHIG